jgi:Ca2+-binding RTX toxin-like protein
MIMAALGNALGDDVLRRAFVTSDFRRAIRPVLGVEEFAVSPRGCTIEGTEADETLAGSGRDDVICARGGDDVVAGGGGEDVIYGDGGDDRISGGGGDRCIGDADDDVPGGC